ncbi:MAG TPA: hypothetical protein VFA20_19605 [Myxococcaceae bacterium]|nr:hypothetical protein [Myxococcaceae bacterium]
MSAYVRILVACSCLGAAPALAGPVTAPVPPTPPAAPKAPAPPAAPAAPKVKKISLKFKGTLREALKQIADKGGINLVITGDLNAPAEVFLSDLPADEVLQTVADAHGLKVHRQGSIWTIRPLTAEEREAISDAKESAEDHDSDSDEADEAEEAEAPTPPEPPAVPDTPDVPDSLSSSTAHGDLPDPVSDPKGFQKRLEERVQQDMRSKIVRKLRNRSLVWGGDNGNDLVSNGHLVIAEGKTVEGDAVAYGGGLDVLGHVEGDAVAYGGGVHLGPHAEVDGDVTSFGGGITREDGAQVGGDEVAFGGGGLGRVVASTIPKMMHEHRESRESSHGSSLPMFLVWFAVLFGAGFLAMMFVPDRVRLLAAEMRRDPLRCGVTGLLGGLISLPLTPLLAITIIGFPVAIALWLAIGLGCLMGVAALANEIGSRLPAFRNVRKTQAVVLASGILLIELIGLIPWGVGGFITAVIAFLSLGAVIRSRFGTRQLGPPVSL